MSKKRKIFGAWGENQAAIYLQGKGYEIIDRNVRTEYGEIDLIARQQITQHSMLVFVEVKTRSSDYYGYPEQSVDQHKQERMLASALAYLQAHPDVKEDWRIDVIAIRRLNPGSPPEIMHFENALT